MPALAPARVCCQIGREEEEEEAGLRERKSAETPS